MNGYSRTLEEGTLEGGTLEEGSFYAIASILRRRRDGDGIRKVSLLPFWKLPSSSFQNRYGESSEATIEVYLNTKYNNGPERRSNGIV